MSRFAIKHPVISCTTRHVKPDRARRGNPPPPKLTCCGTAWSDMLLQQIDRCRRRAKSCGWQTGRRLASHRRSRTTRNLDKRKRLPTFHDTMLLKISLFLDIAARALSGSPLSRRCSAACKQATSGESEPGRGGGLFNQIRGQGQGVREGIFENLMAQGVSLDQSSSPSYKLGMVQSTAHVLRDCICASSKNGAMNASSSDWLSLVSGDGRGGRRDWRTIGPAGRMQEVVLRRGRRM